ncbi:MAG: hypothetical protein ABFD50_08395 [Smithella sp.]
MKGNIESRIAKLENHIGVRRKAETVDAMFQNMQRGEHSLAGIVAAYMSSKDKINYFELLRQQLPGQLVDVFSNKLMEPDRA